ncbi:MAG TPA: hypothetical protein VIG45_05060 [Erysipelothrix sp.]
MIVKDKKENNEKGSVLVLFAATLSLLLVFVALSTDIILAYNRRDHLNEIGQMIREATHDFAEESWNAYNPEEMLTELAREIGRMNGLHDSQVRVEWHEATTSYVRRDARVDIIITDVYETSTLGMFGIREIPIKIDIKGIQFKSVSPSIWSPWR